MHKVGMLKLLTGAALAGFIVVGGAQAQSSGTGAAPAPKVPLPASGPSANPAQPNCYPDVNHCANYPTGDSVKDNSTQYLSPQDIQQQKASQPQAQGK